MSSLVVKDSVSSAAKDTLLVDIINTFQHSANQQCFTVHTIAEPKSDLEVFGMYVGVLLGVLTILYTLYSAYKLSQKNEDAQKQIDKLTEMSEVMLARYRLVMKPRLSVSAYGQSGNTINIHLTNGGELCYYDNYEFLEGDEVNFYKWSSPIEIRKDDRIILQGKLIKKSANDLKFKMKIKYHDQEDFKYESIIEWGEITRIIETKEL